MNFEDHLLQGIPTVDAAEYYIRLLGRDKVATAADFERAMNDLPAEERAALLKRANMGMVSPPALPPTGKGMNMTAPQPMALPPTAMGQQKMGAGDATAVGKERAHAALAAEFEKEKHHQGEGRGGLVGKLLGGAAGAAVMHRYGKGNPLATLGGAYLGEHLGGQVGKHMGAGADRRAYEKGASAFKLALEGAGMPQAPALDPATQQYIAVEQQAQAAQDVNEAQFLRQKLEEARSQQQAADAKSALLEQQQAMSTEQLASAQQQVQQAIEQASQAQDQSTAQSQASAAMRMAYQQLRGQILQLASADPPALNGPDAALAAASTAAGPSSAPAGQSGPAGQSPNPGTPNTVAPEGDDQVSRPVSPNEPMFGNAQPTTYAGTKEPSGDAKIPGKEVLSAVKMAALRDHLSQYLKQTRDVLPHALTGAAIGGAGGLLESKMDRAPLQEHIQQLESNPNRGAKETMDLAGSRARQTVGDFTSAHPGAAALAGALGGAALGASAGPKVVSSLKRSAGHVKEIGQNLKTMAQGA